MLISRLLRPFAPFILFDGDSGGAGGGSGDPANSGGAGGKGVGDPSAGSGQGEATRTFKQSELDALFAERAKQGKQSGIAEMLKELGVEKVDDIKGILQAAKDAETAQMTELQKAQKEAADLKAEKAQAEKDKTDILAQAQEKLLKAAVLAEAAKQGFNDPGDAWLYVNRAEIKTKDDDTFEGLDKALEAVVKSKPYLAKVQRPGDGKGTPNREKKPADQQQNQGQQQQRKPLARF